MYKEKMAKLTRKTGGEGGGIWVFVGVFFIMFVIYVSMHPKAIANADK
jgi:hypothetical protein